MIAKTVVKNKFWVVEDNGQKIATIQATDCGTFVYVHDNEREKFPSIKVLSKAYNIKFVTAKQTLLKEESYHCYGYPCATKPFNLVWDVQRKLPVYSKDASSRSFYCAGYYAIKFGASWTGEYSPKNITLSRYPYSGPFRSKAEMQAFITKA